MLAHLSVSLLGPFEVRLENRLVGGFESNKVRALLAYLATEAAQPHTRAQLGALLWPDAADRAARHSLSQALSSLRRSLGAPPAGGPFIVATPETLQLNPAAPVAIDVDAFAGRLAASEAHAAAHRGWHVCTPCAQRLEQAAVLYRGDFLANFFLRDSVPFEEWARLVRERLRQQVVSTLSRLARYAEWRGRYEQAADYALRQVEMEPLLEAGHRAAMRLLALGGQATAALAQYERLRRTLQQELAAPPEAETTQLYEHLKSGQRPAPTRSSPARLPPPVPPTRLIGREAEVGTALDLLRNQARALTLVGPPGIGKTRLALELARALQFDFEQGVQLVDLTPCAGAAQVPAAVAQALGLPATPEPPERAVAAALKHSHVLLVLDNFEHVLEAGSWAAELLADCPALRLLVTSRSPLGIHAEQLLPLAPLAVPGQAAALDEIAQAPAVRLFLERARSVRPGLNLRGEQAEAIGRLCARVDGLPLAIELVAARTRTAEPTELLRQLEQGLGALGTGARDLPERQRSLNSAIAWSYDRLTAAEQRLFAQVGVFAGGCSAEAAQAVAGGNLEAVAAGLASLHQASLVQRHPGPKEARFSLLAPLREFALAQLQARALAEAARERHARYFLGLAERAAPELVGPNPSGWLARLESDFANLRAALAWGLAHTAPLTLRLATVLVEFWVGGVHLAEGRQWLREALALGQPVAPEVGAWARLAAGRLALMQGDLREAQAQLAESRQLMLHVEDPAGLALALGSLGLAAVRLADFAAGRVFLEESLSIARGGQDSHATALALSKLAELAHRQGNPRLARDYMEEAVALSQARRDRRNTARYLMNLGLAVNEFGEQAAARQHLAASLAIARELDDRILTSLCLLNLGNILLDQGQPAAARATLEEALALYQAHYYWTGADAALATLGRALEQLGDLAGARARQSEALRLRLDGERRGVPLSLSNLARVEWRENRPARAARLLGAAEALREVTGAAIPASGRADYEAFVAGLRSALGEAALAEAWAAGRALSLDEAVALALSTPPA